MVAPKWATPTRKARLVELWAQYGNRCLQGHRVCPEPNHYVQVDGVTGRVTLIRLYELVEEETIRYWVADDAGLRAAE